ncbi:MAG: chemotaxis response regulator protein-glutamate methylesterase [Verrucomicrobiaceae bacterium]|nr:chemotaxis response regulator protein-glutamate methylesterase [Verrucomicrobiaceae bacterium]
MTVTVLIVDDSNFFRRRLTEMIDQCPGLRVIGTANNGREGVAKAIELKPDVITMDYEMPMMDGISAVREIMAKQPTPILMFSSLTYEGARVTLDSLEAGAVDYLPKNFDEISRNAVELKNKLAERINMVAKAGKRLAAMPGIASFRAKTPVAPPAAAPLSKPVRDTPVVRESAHAPVKEAPAASRQPTVRARKNFSLVAIGTSTGGPVALQNVLTALPAKFPFPIVLIQHMPATFTAAFAERLNSLCKIEVKEAVDGDQLRAGVALLAPGGKQMMITKGGKIKILPGDERVNYKPCVDVTFASAANVYRDQVLAIVLTGMGADGCEGARLLKQNGSVVWAQDEATSVIYGMPMAVAKANLADEILPLQQVGARLAELV